MSTVLNRKHTAAEYLARERVAEFKSEFYRGEIFAMSGGNRRHSRISINLVRQLDEKLESGGCEVYDKDMRVKVAANGLYTYPDASVVCGQAQFEDASEDTLLNPRVIFEVLSESTAGYDRGKKFELYRRLESLCEYIVIAQDEPFVERHVRQPDDGWLLTEVRGLESTLIIDAIGCALPLAEIYRRIEFREQTPIQ